MLLLETNKIVYKSSPDFILMSYVGYYSHNIRNKPFFMSKNYDQATYSKLASIYDLSGITIWSYYELCIARD